ncbi:MAG: LysM peptidoglycan-binding domain-containing protein [Calditrichia bacterium]
MKFITASICILLFASGCSQFLNKNKEAITPEAKRQMTLQKELNIVDVYYNLAVSNQAEQDTLDAEYCYQFALSLLDSLAENYDQDSTFLAMQHTVSLSYDRYLDELNTFSEDSLEASAILADLAKLYSESNDSSYRPTGRAEGDMPLVLNRKVENAIKYFTKTRKGRRVMNTWLTRAGRYEKLVKSSLHELGAPTDLFYLAMIESGFRPTARSWARAVGMWQFISATGRAYGLKHSWWYDHRRDPVLATNAAGRHLLDLKKRFGDWYLAIAGYNFSPGKIARRLRQKSINEFWDLPRLPRETRNYVPTYLAAVTIAHDPPAYGFEITPAEPLVFDTVTVKECVDLNVVADIIGSTFKELKNLNPALLRWCTPPDVNSWVLNLPVGSRELFTAKYADIPKGQKVKWLHHRVRNGEALSTISRRYGVAMSEIKRFNKIRGTLIRVGQNLVIPVPQNKPYYNKYVASTQTRKKAKKTRKKTPLKHIKTVDGKEKNHYRVRKGDSLWEIAKDYNVSVTDIRQWNGMGRSRLIKPGQDLVIWLEPGGKKPAKTTKPVLIDLTPEKKATDTRIAASGSTGKMATHKVRSGDTLWDIAQAYNVSIADIKRWNGMRSNKIKPGLELKIYK